MSGSSKEESFPEDEEEEVEEAVPKGDFRSGCGEATHYAQVTFEGCIRSERSWTRLERV